MQSRGAHAPATANSAGEPGVRASGADAREPLLDEDAIGLVEAHDVGDGAERHEVEQRAEIGFGCGREARPRRAARRAVAIST